MSRMGTLSDLLTSVRNAEKRGQEEVVARPVSKTGTEVLKIMQSNGYLGEFEIIDDGKGQVYRIKLLHTINGCGSIKPKLPVRVREIEKWEQRYLPADGFGVVILTTSQGFMTHRDAVKKSLGGSLVAFVY